MKYLLALLAVIAGILLIKRHLKSGSQPLARPQRGEPLPKRGEVQPMIACSLCGTYVPRDDAVEHEGRSYCCREHADRGRAS